MNEVIKINYETENPFVWHFTGKMLTQESGIVKEKQQENDIVKNLKEMEL